jgi:hypothetical protein
MQKKTLVILMGSCRGGKAAWKTQKKYLFDHLDADIALCFGDVDKIDDYLLNIAKYQWLQKDYDNWRYYFLENYTEKIIKYFELGKDTLLAGGIDNYPGSGAIIIAYRDILYRKYNDIISQYEQVVLTRSDYFYLDYHPTLQKDKIWVVKGQDYHGITDRHYVFPGHKSEEILNMCEFFDGESALINTPTLMNPESAFLSYFQYRKIDKQIKRFDRVHFVVKEPEDSTTTTEGRFKLFFYKDLWIKKIYEFEETISNVSFSTHKNVRIITTYFFYLVFLKDNSMRKFMKKLDRKLKSFFKF